MSLSKFGEKLELRSEVEIAAEPAQIWDKITDFSAISSWNPYIVRASGVLARGEHIDLIVCPPGGRELKVRRRIDVLLKGEELRWTGRYGWGFLLRGEQYFQLRSANSPGRTRLTVGENLLGPGVTGNNQTVLNIARGLALMNQALKRQLEVHNG